MGTFQTQARREYASHAQRASAVPAHRVDPFLATLARLHLEQVQTVLCVQMGATHPKREWPTACCVLQATVAPQVPLSRFSAKQGDTHQLDQPSVYRVQMGVGQILDRSSVCHALLHLIARQALGLILVHMEHTRQVNATDPALHSLNSVRLAPTLRIHLFAENIFTSLISLESVLLCLIFNNLTFFWLQAI